MSDLNKEALAIWESLKPAVDKEIERKTAGTVQRRKVVVSTAPSSLTGLVGVQEPFGVEFFVPYRTEVATATVGDPVWIEFAYGANNAVAIGMASLVDTGTQTFDDVTITGTLDITSRRCEATLSSAGWYRAIVYNAYDSYSANGYSGEIVTIKTVYTSAVSCQHIIKLFMSYNKIVFLGEESHGTTNVLDKIRYTVNGSKGYVDIHWPSSTACQVNVSFEVASRTYAQGNWVASDLTAVADAPTGETVLTTHNFQSNNALWQSATITPTLFNLAGSITLNGNIIWYKSDKSVLQFSTIANINITSRTGGNGGFKFNLPFAYNGPTTDINVGTQSKFSNEFVYIHLTNGSSEVIVRTTETNTNLTTGAVRYLISQVTLFMN